MFYDAPSSPVGDDSFFPDNPLPLRYVDSRNRRSLIKEDVQKNMTEFSMTFLINEVLKGFVKIFIALHLILVFHIHVFCVDEQA